MSELKPTWRIAQQISRRHTWISLKITLPLFLGVIIISIIILKLLGYSSPGITLRHFWELHRGGITYIAVFVQFVPVNYYAIMQVFKHDFEKFQLKIVAK